MQASDVMTTDPTVCPAGTTVLQAAELMRDRGIGDVLVSKGDHIFGIVTDRDIAVRAVADRRDPGQVTLEQICSRGVHWVEPAAPVDDVIDIMRQHAVRRVPVLDHGRPVGIVSLGDLAVEREGDSVLGRINRAYDNR
jgi:CBS domain-containing protein